MTPLVENYGKLLVLSALDLFTTIHCAVLWPESTFPDGWVGGWWAI